MTQVHHPICSTLRVFDIADTSVTNYGLLTILRKMPQLHSLGEFSISDNFLRSLCVVTSLKVRKQDEVITNLLSQICFDNPNSEFQKECSMFQYRWTNLAFTLSMQGKYPMLESTIWFTCSLTFAHSPAGSHNLIQLT